MAWDRTWTLASPQSTRSPSIQTFPTGVMGIDSSFARCAPGRLRGGRRGLRQDIGSGQVVRSPQDLKVGLHRPLQRAESRRSPSPELGTHAVPDVVRDPPGPGVHPGVHLVQELPDGGVVVGRDRRQQARPSPVAFELAVERGWVPGVEPHSERDASCELQEPVDDPPRVIEPTEAHERGSAGADDAIELLDEPLPLGDEVEHPPDDGAAERTVAERHPGGVGQDEREGDGAARLLHQLGQHRPGQVEPDHRHARAVQGERDESGPHSDLQAAPPSCELTSQQLDGGPFRLRGERTRPVVELGRPIESPSDSSGRNPMEPKATTFARSGSSKSATTTAAWGWTGPPMNSGSPGATRSARGGAASLTGTSVARFSTTPTAPSSSWWPISTTVRRKLGSHRSAPAISRWPFRLSIRFPSSPVSVGSAQDLRAGCQALGRSTGRLTQPSRYPRATSWMNMYTPTSQKADRTPGW